MPTIKTISNHLGSFVIEGAYIPREYYVFDDLQLVYMPIYKVASTSIKTALLRPGQEIGSYPHYMTVHQESSFGQHSLLARKPRRYFKFAFVRNPFERLVSCYEDRVRREMYVPIGRYYFDSEYNHVLIRRLFGASFKPEMSFRDFVALVSKIPDVLADGHFKSQYGWTHRFGNRIPDYIGKLETLDEDWEPIASRFGLSHLEHTNSSNRRDIATYFATPEIVQIAARRYQKDIRAFGYEDEYWRLLRGSQGRLRVRP